MRLSLNADVGEGFGRYDIGHDSELMPLITAANVACGMHAGDPIIMARTVRLAKRHGVSVGAHPGFNDLWGFGRRPQSMALQDVEYLIAYQIGALMGIAAKESVPVKHVKPHGALNNQAETDCELALAIARGIRSVDRDLAFVACTGSEMIVAGERVGLRVIPEIYADRAYGADHRLLPRNRPNAVVAAPEQAASQIKLFLENGRIRNVDGQTAQVCADTICIHSDNAGAVGIANAVRSVIAASGAQLVAI